MGMKYFEVCCAILIISEWDGVFLILTQVAQPASCEQ